MDLFVNIKKLLRVLGKYNNIKQSECLMCLDRKLTEVVFHKFKLYISYKNMVISVTNSVFIIPS